MIDTERDFLNLFHNIKTNIIKGSRVIILFMDGMRIHQEFVKNSGVISVVNDEKELVFELRAKYPYTNKEFKVFGNKMSVYLSGTYGLQNTIEENLVIPDILIKFFERNGFKQHEKINFLDIYPNDVLNLKQYQKDVIGYYTGLVFEYGT